VELADLIPGQRDFLVEVAEGLDFARFRCRPTESSLMLMRRDSADPTRGENRTPTAIRSATTMAAIAI